MANCKGKFQTDTGLSLLLADLDVKDTVKRAAKVEEAVVSVKKKAEEALGLAPEIGWSMLHASAVADAAKDVTKAYTKAKKAGAKAEKDTLKAETIANFAAEKGEMTIYSKAMEDVRRVVYAAYKVEECTKIIETLQQKLAGAISVSKMRRREKTRSAAALRRSLARSSKVALSSVKVDISDERPKLSEPVIRSRMCCRDGTIQELVGTEAQRLEADRTGDYGPLIVSQSNESKGKRKSDVDQEDDRSGYQHSSVVALEEAYGDDNSEWSDEESEWSDDAISVDEDDFVQFRTTPSKM